MVGVGDVDWIAVLEGAAVFPGCKGLVEEWGVDYSGDEFTLAGLFGALRDAD